MRRVNEGAGRLIAGAVLLSLAAPQARGEPATCADGRAPIFLTFDTGTQSQAEVIRAVLRKHDVRATFFVANENGALGDAWAPFWKALAADGHAFGSHTYDHVYFRGDAAGQRVRMRAQYGGAAGRTVEWDAGQVCAELQRVAVRFEALTGTRLDPFWRAPGGHVSPRLIGFGRSCGYRHFGWSAAGFLGDELPSERYPNALLLERAVKTLGPGDIAMAHLGIRSRHEPMAPILDPLIGALKSRGHCFATLRVHPTGRS